MTETEGGSVEFQCQLLFPENEKVDFMWYKNVTGELSPLKESSTIEITNSEEVVNNKTVKFTKLRISNVQEADRGEYVCEAKNEFGSHSEQFMLRVKSIVFDFVKKKNSFEIFEIFLKTHLPLYGHS